MQVRVSLSLCLYKCLQGGERSFPQLICSGFVSRWVYPQDGQFEDLDKFMMNGFGDTGIPYIRRNQLNWFKQKNAAQTAT